jgi:hypothetical protein
MATLRLSRYDARPAGYAAWGYLAIIGPCNLYQVLTASPHCSGIGWFPDWSARVSGMSEG